MDRTVTLTVNNDPVDLDVAYDDQVDADTLLDRAGYDPKRHDLYFATDNILEDDPTDYVRPARATAYIAIPHDTSPDYPYGVTD